MRIVLARRLFWALLLILPLQAAALSLGELNVRSAPGEPLQARIPFTLLPGESLSEVRVTLGSAEEYQKRHMERAELLDGVTLALFDKGDGNGHLRLFSEQAWQGEAVALLLMISWSKGMMERQYQLAAVATSETSTPVYVEVTQDERLDEIAIRLSKGRSRSYLHMMYALFKANPDAFYRGNMNNLKSGQTLRVPSNEELYALSDREVFDGIRSQYEAWQQLRESKQQRGTQAGEALAGMSAEQAATLDLTLDSGALQQRLQQVAAESEAIRQENEELRQRLQQLEQRMQNVAGQVLEYAEDGSATSASSQPVEKGEPSAEEAEKASDEADSQGLSGSTMFVATVLVLLFIFYLLYSNGRSRRGSS